MKSLYIECNMGAAGDMLMSALSELAGGDFIEKMNAAGLPGVSFERHKEVKCGISGTRISVEIAGEEEISEDIKGWTAAAEMQTGHVHEDGHSHGNSHEHECEGHIHDHFHEHHGEDHSHDAHGDAQGHSHSHGGHNHPHTHSHDGEHSHSHDHAHSHDHSHSHIGLAQIGEIVGRLPVSENVKQDVTAVYAIIAEAESKAHGQPVETVHFHEVGVMDAVADILGVCLLIEELAPEKIVVSPIHVGSGQVRCAHGILPVPAPATAYILQGIPTYGGKIQGELCTPTGAALLKHFADSFGGRPIMTVEKIGYGMGKKDFPAANCVRVFLGEAENEQSGEAQMNQVSELSCNLDDMTGEELGFAAEMLLEAGVLDVFITPIQMKKNRPGQLLTCLCKAEDEERIAALMLRHTTSFGIRAKSCRRYILERNIAEKETKYGRLRVKTGKGYGVTKSKTEYEDAAKIARESGKSLIEMRER